MLICFLSALYGAQDSRYTLYMCMQAPHVPITLKINTSTGNATCTYHRVAQREQAVKPCKVKN